MPVLTLPSVQHDFVEWRLGRRYYAVWALDFDHPMLRQASGEICAALPDYWLPDYVRGPHLTVSLCGFPAAQARRDDDYALTHFTAQLQALSDAAPVPFAVEIGAPGSFTSAAYFSARDLDNGIEQLRCLLGEADDSGFVPHVTFGLYRAALPLHRVLGQLRAHNRLITCQLEVHKLSWMVYEAAVIGGPLYKLGEFDLATRRFEVVDQPQFEAIFA